MDEGIRDIGDVEATRQAIWDSALDAAQHIEPVSNNRYTLGLKDVRWQGKDRLPKSEHKKALMNGTYLTRRLSGTWVLTDNATGKPVAERRSVIAHIPYMTDMGTFVRGGNDYALSHQLRLKPGVYTRWLDNGELEAHVNVSHGLGSKIFLEPETGVFKMKMGQANIPVTQILGMLGCPEAKMKKAWGQQVYDQNAGMSDPKALNKLYDKLSYGIGEAKTPAEKQLAIQRAFMKMELDPRVSQLTLGKPYSAVNADVLLDTTAKLLRINRGEQDTDSRDDMAYQRLLGPEDLIAERLKNTQGLMRQYLWKASSRSNLDRMPAGAFDSSVDAALIGSGLGMPLESINPIELFDNQFRVTRLGDGGIASLDAVPDSARNVHPSQLGLIDFIRTPESLKVGVDSRMSGSVRKGRDGQMYAQLIDAAGRPVWKSASDMATSVVAFPGAMQSKNTFVPVVYQGRLMMLPKDRVNYSFMSMQAAQHATGRLVPMTSSAKGQRAVMAARMLTQALPLENREAPLVQSAIPDQEDKSYEELYGEKFGAIRAKNDCQVVSVTPDKIVVKDKNGNKDTIDLYRDLVFNRKTGLNQTPVVKPGDVLKAGSLMASSNFTDNNGAMAVGINARVAFLPFKGLNYEDAIVISNSFAKKMASQHYYKNRLPGGADTVFDKNRFLSVKPGLYKKEQTDNFTDDGVIKPGTVVHPGDPLILAISKVEPTEAQLKMGRKAHWKDSSVKWEHHDDGVVTDVYHDDKGAQVVVKSRQEMQIGDKMSGRYGNKGVVNIVPDEELPSLPDGTKPEVLMSPLAIVSRVNPAFIHETILGKIAKVTGKRYAIKDFADDADRAKFVLDEAKKYGVKDVEDMFDETDPDHPKVIPSVLNGYTYMMKLHHSSESKAQGRGIGRYTMDFQPAKGGDDGAKRMGMLELSALLSHGATQNVVDMKFVKGQENMDYWRQYLAGYNPPTPRVPYVYQKFVNYLEGAGMHVRRDGPRLNIMALTAKDVDNLAGDRELKGVKDPRTGLQTLPTVSWNNNLQPLAGGLFDPKMTGGHAGNQWSYIKLDSKYPNPVMEEPLRRMLNITEADFRDVMAGKKTIETGTGPDAIYKAACNLNIENELARARNDIKSGRKTYRDAAVKRLGYLKSAQALGQEPKDWFMDKVPVLPPFFRPVSQMGNEKLPLVSDPNYLYKQLFDTNQAYKANRKIYGDEGSGELSLGVYDAFKAVTGLGDPTTQELKQKEVKGLLKSIFGVGPKYSMMQSRLLGTPVDMVGRGTVVVDPDLDMDTVGLPENIAWDTYKPFIIKELRRHGYNGIQALDAVDKKSSVARDMLIKVMQSRPVLVNRAPSLHKYNIMAMMPRLIKGDTVKVSPFITPGMNMDFDGDTVVFHVPSTEAAAQEAIERMLPSHNLLSAGDFKVMPKITREHLIGLYEATRPRKGPAKHTYRTAEDVVAAYRRGDLDPQDKVIIMK